MADDYRNHEVKKKKKHKKKQRRNNEPREDEASNNELDHSEATKQHSSLEKSPKEVAKPTEHATLGSKKKMSVRNKNEHREWSFAEEKRLLDEIKRIVSSSDEKSHKFVEWSKIKMDGSFSEVEIIEQYKKLTKKVRKLRTVGEIIIDAQKLLVEKPKSLKDKGPAKPMNSFMLFCKSRRGSLVKKHPGLSFAEIHKKMCERWKEMPDTKREKYTKKYEEAKQQYSEELEQFNKKQIQGIRKPLSAYEMWKLEKEADEQNNNEDDNDYMAEWDGMPNSMKKGWLQAATSERERYETEVNCITKKQPRKKKNAKSTDLSSEEPGNEGKKKTEVSDGNQSSPSKEKSKRKLHKSKYESPSKKLRKEKSESSELEHSEDSN